MTKDGKLVRAIVVAGLTLAMGSALAGTANAHHSTAAFDYTKNRPLAGTVKEFRWTSPHMFINVTVPDKTGKTVLWSIECGVPNMNVRNGWKKSDIKTGDKVALIIHPNRDGSPGGTLVSVKLPDGRTLFGPGGDIVPVQRKTGS